jgi:hypothetical protein
MQFFLILCLCCIGILSCKKEQEIQYTNLHSSSTSASEIDHVNMPTIIHFEGTHTLTTHETGWYLDNPFADTPHQIFIDTTYIETITFGHNHTPYLIVNGNLEYVFNGMVYSKIDPYGGGYNYSSFAHYTLNTTNDSILFDSGYNCPTSARHYSSYGKKQ